jgi:ankyrin repeat protein
MTALHFAAGAGEAEMVRRLLAEGAEVEAYSSYRGTPLNMAARAGAVESARLLLEAGAEVQPPLRTGAESVFTEAVKSGQVELVKALVEAGAHPVEAQDYRVAHSAAVAAGDAELLRLVEEEAW